MKLFIYIFFQILSFYVEENESVELRCLCLEVFLLLQISFKWVDSFITCLVVTSRFY